MCALRKEILSTYSFVPSSPLLEHFFWDFKITVIKYLRDRLKCENKGQIETIFFGNVRFALFSFCSREKLISCVQNIKLESKHLICVSGLHSDKTKREKKIRHTKRCHCDFFPRIPFFLHFHSESKHLLAIYAM